MIGLKATTQENLVRGKEKNMFYFTEKHDFTGAISPRHNALFL
jgi:hypothetical protein